MQSDRDRMMRRLGYYLMGLALGCVLLGIYFQGRQAQVARQQQAARAEAERAAQTAPNPASGPEGAANPTPNGPGPAGAGPR